jgi:hypothetical protein
MFDDVITRSTPGARSAALASSAVTVPRAIAASTSARRASRAAPNSAA